MGVPMQSNLSTLLDEATCAMVKSRLKVSNHGGFPVFCGLDIEMWWSLTRFNVRVTRNEPICMSGFARAQRTCFIQRMSTSSTYLEQVCSSIHLQSIKFGNVSHVNAGVVLHVIDCV